jgi:uncharacterized RDD family membrane protein YckC
MSNSYGPDDNRNPYTRDGVPQSGKPQGGFPPAGYPLVSPYPGAGARLGAYVIDLLVVGVAMAVVMLFVVWDDVSAWIDDLDQWDGNGDAPDLNMGGFYLISILSIIIWMAYRICMETWRGQTVGKMALKMKVVDVDGQLPTAQASFLRNSWYLISAVLSFIPVVGWVANVGIPAALGVTISRDPYRQSFTDHWGRTYVVSTRPTF